ncbi:hypothetical protein MTOK_38390 [Mycolicibacterium tokaiense]|nr:hypothetical protein MTOK_38390 [Mycolicibacterium tokaiense]
MCAELANRGVKDVLIACVDGLTGFGDAIAATWPQTIVQTCTVHLLRSSMRFVAYGDRKQVASALRLIYTAPTIDAAEIALHEFAASAWGKKYPTTVRAWEAAWDRFIPFLSFPPAVRKIIYTTNAIESLNYQLRKIIKNRGHFPNDQAAVKLCGLRSAISKTNAPENAFVTATERRPSGTSKVTVSSKAPSSLGGSTH